MSQEPPPYDPRIEHNADCKKANTQHPSDNDRKEPPRSFSALRMDLESLEQVSLEFIDVQCGKIDPLEYPLAQSEIEKGLYDEATLMLARGFVLIKRVQYPTFIPALRRALNMFKHL